MSLENQIQLISNPQEFTRLYNAVLSAEYGDDFIAIDDDRPDRGNDGYLKSERRVFAGHCFKRLHNQSLDGEIRAKMVSDLRKAIELKRDGSWRVEAWTFICNYPVPEAIGRDILSMAAEAGIEAAWRGCMFLAAGLQARPELRAMFPALEVNEVIERLEELRRNNSGFSVAGHDWNITELRDVPTEEEIAELRRERPELWEFLLFAKVMRRERALLGVALLDHEACYAPRIADYLDDQAAASRMNFALSELSQITGVVESLFTPEMQTKAFGEPGEAGDALRITHMAERVTGCIRDLLEWAARVRGVTVSEEMAEVFDALAHLVDQPIRDILSFIEEYHESVQRIPELLAKAGDEPIHLQQRLTLNSDPKALENFSEALAHFHSAEDA